MKQFLYQRYGEIFIVCLFDGD